MNDMHQQRASGPQGRAGGPEERARHGAPSAKGPGAAGRPVGELLDVAARRAAPVIRAIPDDLLTAPTPCSDYDVRALVNHLWHVAVQFRGLAAKQDSDFSLVPDYVGEGLDAGEDWRERFAAAVERLVEAWSAPGAEEGTTGAMHMPARTVGCMALLDLTVHPWDLARATGQEYRPDAECVDVLRVLADAVAELAPTARKMGVFADPVPLPDDIPSTDGFARLLAETGRDPHWTPPAPTT